MFSVFSEFISLYPVFIIQLAFNNRLAHLNRNVKKIIMITVGYNVMIFYKMCVFCVEMAFFAVGRG